MFKLALFFSSALKFPELTALRAVSAILNSTCLMWAKTTLREALSAFITMCRGNDNHRSAESTVAVLLHVAGK